MFRSRGKFTGGVCGFSAGLGKVRSGLLQCQGAGRSLDTFVQSRRHRTAREQRLAQT